MQINQIYELMNDVTKEVLGETAMINEDLSNVVELGTSIFNANAVDKYVKALVNHIGRVVFVNRPYVGRVPSVLMDKWEFGSVLERIRIAELPEAEENESWELQDGTSYDPNIFYQPKVAAKFFNKLVTFEVPISFTEKQVKQSFSNAGQLNAFISMIEGAVEKSMTVKLDKLVMQTIDNMIGETIHAEYGSESLSSKSTVKAVNLLKEYNDTFGASLTAEVAIKTPEFIRYASYRMGLVADRMGVISKLFNIGATEKFTPKDLLHVVLLSDFAKAADSYLQSDTYHNTYVSLPNHETVPFWQATGTGYSFNDVTGINIKTASNNTVTATGILGVMFDRDALGVCNQDRRITSNYNPKAEFYSNWHKWDAEYFNDTDENFVVFFAA